MNRVETLRRSLMDSDEFIETALVILKQYKINIDNIDF